MSRYIIFNNRNSEEMGLTMSGSTPLSIPIPKLSATQIDLSDGYIDTSRIDGVLHYQPRGIGYIFVYVIDAYDENDMAKSADKLNDEVKEKVDFFRDWAYEQTNRKLYDTLYCDPLSKSGYYFENAACTKFVAEKAIGNDVWLIQIQMEFTFNPYMYEFNAEPVDFVHFAGPTEDAVGMGQSVIRFYNRGTAQRMIWTNDNNTMCNINASPLIGPEYPSGKWYTGTLTFKPSAAGIYSGPIGFYWNHYMNYTYNGKTYSYRMDFAGIVSGNLSFMDSAKIVTPNEIGYTDQNGFVVRVNIEDLGTGANALSQLIDYNSDLLPASVIWGAAKIFDTPLDQEYVIHGVTKGPHTFQQVTGHDASSIQVVTKRFDEPFVLDDDSFNELRMDSTNFGFYTLSNSDTLRKVL